MWLNFWLRLAMVLVELSSNFHSFGTSRWSPDRSCHASPWTWMSNDRHIHFLPYLALLPGNLCLKSQSQVNVKIFVIQDAHRPGGKDQNNLSTNFYGSFLKVYIYQLYSTNVTYTLVMAGFDHSIKHVRHCFRLELLCLLFHCTYHSKSGIRL